MREAGYAGRAQVSADSVVKITTARAQGAVGFAEVFAAFVEAAEFLSLLVKGSQGERGWGRLTRERDSTSLELRTSKRDA